MSLAKKDKIKIIIRNHGERLFTEETQGSPGRPQFFTPNGLGANEACV